MKRAQEKLRQFDLEKAAGQAGGRRFLPQRGEKVNENKRNVSSYLLC